MLLPLHMMMNLRAADAAVTLITDTFIPTLAERRKPRRSNKPALKALKRALAATISDALNKVAEPVAEPVAAPEPVTTDQPAPQPAKRPLTRPQINQAARIAHANLMRMRAFSSQTREATDRLSEVVQALVADRAQLVVRRRDDDEILMVIAALVASGHI